VAGATRADYLDVIEGVVRYFQPFQNTDPASIAFGRILDPLVKIEIQYSTPCFVRLPHSLLYARISN
jgi:hypothetical protein